MAVWSEVDFSDLPTDLRFDAEYHDPKFLNRIQAIKRSSHAPLSDLADILDGNHAAISEQYCEQGVRYLRGQDLSDFFISDHSPLYIPENQYQKIPRCHMKEGDVLVGIVGTIGSVGFVTDRFEKLTGNCKLAIVRGRKVAPEFLAAFLASRLGQDEIRRRIRGSVQTGLILPDLKTIPVPILSQEQRISITEIIRKARSKRAESVSLYQEAESLWLCDLGLTNLETSPELCYESTYSKTGEAGRMDAEFFQPRFRHLLQAVKLTQPERAVPLGEFCKVITNGHTPKHHDFMLGDVPFLMAEQVLDFRIHYDTDKFLLRDQHEGELKRTRLQQGDLLITIKGRIGNAAIVEDLPGPVNVNQDIARIRLREEVPPYYVLAFINSLVGKGLVQKYCTGQINPFLSLANLRLIPIPIYEDERMQSIAAGVKKTVWSARAAQEESGRLLEEAKRMVEQAI